MSGLEQTMHLILCGQGILKENFIYKNIKKKLNIVFKNNKTALLVFTNFPKKNSRANTMSLLDKDTFLKNN